MDILRHRVNVLINKAYYSTKRYKTFASFVYIYHEKEISNETLGSFMRLTDNFVQVDQNHVFVNFTFTEQSNVFKAAQNLLFKLDNYFQDTTSCAAMDTYDINKSADIVFRRLQQILEETKQNSFNRIEDEEILNSQF
ncbi:hypothetical protein [Sulfurimonas sp.]|uniref:hypothetical protein n=1 Tax=Sulfurimonas sp. TaxID=2022749 RepID=UPI003D12AE63